MSTAGLRKVGNYEETLAAAIKDEQHVAGIINPCLANAATRIINPDFQRVKDRLEDDLSQQTRMHMDQTNYENNVTNLAVDARINRADLDYIVTNLQQPPAPPAPPPPPNDAAADRARLIAELDGLAMERERQSRQEMMAQRNAMELAAQRVATPAQEIIREFHQQPIYIPVELFSVPATSCRRRFGGRVTNDRPASHATQPLPELEASYGLLLVLLAPRNTHDHGGRCLPLVCVAWG